MAMYAKARRLRLREGLSIGEIARRAHLSRNTIKTWLKEPLQEAMVYRRKPAPTELDAHAWWLGRAVEADARRPRGQRRTAKRLFEQLRALGYVGT